jgi:acyl CoA:acetate/3-ketoacid CoA transferase beta subunit
MGQGGAEMVEKEKLDRETIALRAAKEFQDGMIVNLGIGIPTTAANFIPEDREVIFHTENGCLGFGPIADPENADIDLVNASTQAITAQPGMSFFDHADCRYLRRVIWPTGSHQTEALAISGVEWTWPFVPRSSLSRWSM